MSRLNCGIAALALIVLACTSGGTATSPETLVDHVTITGGASSLALGTQLNLTANAYSANNTELSDRNFSWGSSDPTTASVVGSGGYATVTPRAAGGPVTITATLDGTAGRASFTVTQAPTISLSTSSLTFNAVVNGGTIATQSVTVNNVGTGSLTNLTIGPITYMSGSNWITSASLNTTTAPATLTLGVNSGLGAGTYSATVPITSSASGVTNATTIFVTLILSPPLFAQLALTTPPSATAMVNVPFVVQPVLQLLDANGAAVAQNGAVITATLATGSGTLGGTITATTNAAGAASFTNLSLSAAGSNTILFSVTVSSGALSVTSQPIVVSVPTVTLTIQAAGVGSGTVTSSPGAINCTSTAGTTSGTCSVNYSSGTPVTLTATPTSGAFAGWSGACTNGSGTCQVTMSQTQLVTASFGTSAPGLTVVAGGAGSGTVTAPAVGGQQPFNCTITNGSAVSGCTQSYPAGTQVQLTATGTGGGGFAGWSTPCTGFANPCTVTSSTTITATFVPPGTCPNTTFSLGIAVTGTLTSTCPAFTSYYASYSTLLASAQTIAISLSASFDPVALGVQVSSTGSAVGFFGTSPLQFKILAPAGTLTLFPNGYTSGTTGTFSFVASQTSAFVANCESAVLVPGGTWNESLATAACTNGQYYYDAYVIEIPAGATATATMISIFGPALALYDQTTSMLVTSAGALGNVSTMQYTNSSGQSAIYELRATSGNAGLTGLYSLSFSLTGPGSLRQAGSSSGGYSPVWAGIPVHHGPP
jgi:hypothetical protein